MISGKHRFNLVKKSLRLSNISDLGNFLDTLNALIFQVLSQLATHRLLAVFLNPSTGRDEAHLLGLAE